MWDGGVSRAAEAVEMRAAGFEPFDDGEQVAGGAGEAVEPNQNWGSARAAVA